MPNLSDLLKTLDSHTAQIHSLALETSTSIVPLSGRFTQAYLQGTENILDIIREAQPHERSLFGYIGEGDGGGGGGGNTTAANNKGGSGADNSGAGGGGVRGKIAQKRKVGLVTPLKKVPTGRGGNVPNIEDPVKLLKAALTLVEE